MKVAARILPVILLFSAACLTASRADQTYLEALFNDKTIDAAIGTGGAVLGEPIAISYGDATVRSTPFETPGLELVQTDPQYRMGADFGFLNDVVPSTGLVVVSMDFYFEEISSGHEFQMRFFTEGFMANFFVMQFMAGPVLQVWTDGVSPETIATPPIGSVLPVLVAFDLDAQKYSVWLNGESVVTDRALTAGGGPYRFFLGPRETPTVGQRMWVDQIRVIDWMPSVAARNTTWGRVRALYR
jgi:hypothetical protein